MRKTTHLIMFVSVLLLGLGKKASAKDHPNVILILTDDQGYGDLSCHGHPVLQTPNMDKLHAESVRFTDFHVDPTCAPTRSALTTGKYSHHVGVWHTIAGGNHLRPSEVTMAEVFKQSGYRTGLFGKWHLGANYPFRPMDRGFDEWLGHGDGGTGTTDDWFTNDRVNDMYWHNGKREFREGYAPDVFFNSAIDFIKSNNQKKQPFFVEIATYLPHHPHTVPDVAMIDEFKGKVAPHNAYLYAGIRRIDDNVGRLRAELEKQGIAENTIVIFMTDNGAAWGVDVYNAGMRGRKCQVYEGGHRVPFFLHWEKAGLNKGIDVTDLTAHIDVLPTLIDLCDLKSPKRTTFDGQSLRKHLFNPSLPIPERTLFVETQRNFEPVKWLRTVGMKGTWRLIDNKELYNIKTDPSQKENVIDAHPDIVKEIREKHKAYWARVSLGDRDVSLPIVGTSHDEEIFLTSSDWHAPKVPWNHAQVAKSSSLSGGWHIRVAKKASYTFEVSRYPREAEATIQGVPEFTQKIDSYQASGGVSKLVYGDEVNAMPIEKIRLKVGDVSQEKIVKQNDRKVVFELTLNKGDYAVEGLFLDENDKTLSGAYYIYVK